MRLPALGTLVEVTLLPSVVFRSRVEDAGEEQLSLAAPLRLRAGDVPETGAELEVRWVAGVRGRFVALAYLVERRPGPVPLWLVRPSGLVTLEQSREFVRGGGGEPVVLLRNASDAFRGFAVDVSEGGLHVRFGGRVPIAAGDDLHVTLDLDGDPVEATGHALRTLTDPDGRGSHVVVSYVLSESQARLVRRYVLKHQLVIRNLA